MLCATESHYSSYEGFLNKLLFSEVWGARFLGFIPPKDIVMEFVPPLVSVTLICSCSSAVSSPPCVATSFWANERGHSLKGLVCGLLSV